MKKLFILFVIAIFGITGCTTIPSSQKPGDKNTNSGRATSSEIPLKDKFVSKPLNIEFEMPFSDCTEEEYIADGGRQIDDFVPQGRRNQIFCDNHSFWVAAVSKNWKQYEGLLISPLKYPSIQEEIDKCITSTETNCKYYKTPSNDGEIFIFVMDVSSIFDGGNEYWLISYVPIKNSPYYEVAKFSQRIGRLPDYSDKNYKKKTQEYIANILNKKLNKEDLQKVEIFEKTLLSIKNISAMDSQETKTQFKKGTYENTDWGFTIEIPEGFRAFEEKNQILILENSEDGPPPELSIQIQNGTLEEYKNMLKATKEENLTVGNIKGKIFSLSYQLRGIDYECRNYVLEDKGTLYDFSSWECMGSDIILPLVQSFKITNPVLLPNDGNTKDGAPKNLR